MSKIKTNQVTRRRFLGATSALAAASVSWTAKSYAKILGANDRLRVGFIGAGGMAGSHMATYNDLKEKNNLEAMAVAMVIPAEGPSLGMAPSGTCTCRSLLTKNSSRMPHCFARLREIGRAHV